MGYNRGITGGITGQDAPKRSTHKGITDITGLTAKNVCIGRGKIMYDWRSHAREAKMPVIPVRPVIPLSVQRFKVSQPVIGSVIPCYTEQEVYDKLCHWNGGPIQDKGQARAKLMEMINETPGLLYELPDTLLDKLGIHHDQVFTPAELALAQAVRGRCTRRIVCQKL